MNLAFEFQDDWNEGLGLTRESVIRFLPEASERGLVMRVHWAWMKGEIPRWTRIWLIDRGGRLPDGYQLKREDDGRYKYDSIYGTMDDQARKTKQKKNYHVYIDGTDRYVESYMWDHARPRFQYKFPDFDVPVLSFIWTMRWLCLPPRGEEYRATVNLPNTSEHLFRVLRQLPGTDGTGYGKSD